MGSFLQKTLSGYFASHMSRDPARLWNAEMIAMKEKQGIPSDQLTNLARICYEVKPELHLSYQMTEHMADLSYGSFNP